jgi:hypothetical protein
MQSNNENFNIEAETDSETDNDTSYSDGTEFSIDSINDVELLNLNSTYLTQLSFDYKLVIPELYNKYIHGKTTHSDQNINGQYMVLQSFKRNNNTNVGNLFKYINKMSSFYRKYYEKNFTNLKHDIIRNYNHIIKRPNYLNVEICKINYLSGDECVCIIKTFWLKIIQRVWKKIYKMRMIIMKKRFKPASLLYRQQTRKWPDDCNYMPSIRGMLILS